jgi:hypothetical protein
MNEADRRREFEIDILARVERLEEYRDTGAIARNAEAMRETIEHWNKQFLVMEARQTALDNNITNFLQIVKDIQDNNTLALAKLLGGGPTA